MASTTAALSCPKIMKRPAAAQDARNETAVVASSEAPENKNDTLCNNNDSTSDHPSSLILDKEEKKVDHGMMVMKREGQAGSVVDGAAPPTADGQTPPESEDDWFSKTDDPDPVAAAAPAAPSIKALSQTAWDPLEEVDSALLSALCDQRERKALYKLEQVMLDFMKDRNTGFMEVGGAYNSIVLNQNSWDANGQAMAGPGAVSQQGLQELQYQQQRGLRQTSFQRLVLHRLADRFNIIREQINDTSNYMMGNGRGLVDVGGNMGGQQFFSPGLIRLIKTNESCTPSNLLIDIDLSLLINYKNPRARNYGQGGNYAADDNARSLSENMASATFAEAPSAAATGDPTTKKPNKKMVIMRRNTSSGGDSEGTGKGKQKGKSSRKKKLEDREKAYEEARARIFGKVSESSGNENNSDDNGDNGERAMPQSAGDPQDNGANLVDSCHSSFSIENDATPPTSPTAAAGGGEEHVVPSQPASATPSTDQSSPPTPEPRGNQEPASSSPPEAGANEAETTSRQPSRSSSTSSFPVAATGGAISKAVYRNRQQEETDPDFKRRSDIRPAYVPAPYVANPYGGPPPGGAHHYPAMGQPPTPQMMAAMQMQQQAHPPPYFYHHGQQPPHFPTPQDATYAMAMNAQQQWVAPHNMGYYPPPPQQGVPENHHPQSWQPPPQNPGQMPAPNAGPNSANYGAQMNAPANVVNNPQQTQPAKWGPGTQRGESNSSEVSSPEGAPVTTREVNDDGAVYKPEDFPALG